MCNKEGYPLEKIYLSLQQRSLWGAWLIPTFFSNYSLTLFSLAAFFISILSATVGAEGIYFAILSGAVILVVIWIANRYSPGSLSSKPRHILQDHNIRQETIRVP
jgi:hypothetical protein